MVLFIISCGSPSSISILTSYERTTNQVNASSFLEYCNDDNAEDDIKHTIHVMKKYLLTSYVSCEVAFTKLQTFKEIDLVNTKLTNIEPLAGFSRLKKLNLASNHIKNIDLLENLKSLESLNLYDNQIEDISSPLTLKISTSF